MFVTPVAFNVRHPNLIVFRELNRSLIKQEGKGMSYWIFLDETYIKTSISPKNRAEHSAALTRSSPGCLMGQRGK